MFTDFETDKKKRHTAETDQVHLGNSRTDVETGEKKIRVVGTPELTVMTIL